MLIHKGGNFGQHSQLHHDSEKIRDLAERTVMEWQNTARHLEDRVRLIVAAIGFYKTARDVSLKSLNT